MVRYDVLTPAAVALLVVSLVLTGGVSAAEHEGGEAVFDVEITGTNGPVAAGETLVVTATVTNTGDAAGSQQIHLKRPGMKVVDSVAGPPLTLAPNETEIVTLRWQTGQGDAGDGNISVQSNDDFPREPVTIEESAFFDVSIAEADGPISAGETLDVTVNVTNTGGAAALAPTWVAADGSMVDMTVFYLAPGQTKQAHLTWDSDGADSGVRAIAAGTAGDRAETSLVVEAGGPTGEDATTDRETTAPGASPKRTAAVVP